MADEQIKKPRKPRIRSLQKNGLPQRLLNIIQSGEERTQSELCELLEIKREHFMQLIAQLRRHGYPVFPVGTKTGIGHKTQQGVYKLVTNSITDTVAVNTTYRNNYITPALKTSFMLWQRTIESFPELHARVQQDLESLMVLLIQQKQQVLGQPSEPTLLSLPYAQPTDHPAPDQPAQARQKTTKTKKRP